MSPDAIRPNIIVFLSDQQRWDTCGCYGQPLPVTPHLDRMAAEGVRFESAFSCQPVCGPARACLQTGKYATETGCVTNHCRLPDDETTLPRWLRAVGYECGYIGKWHLASSGPAGGPNDFQTRPVPPERRGGYDDFWLASDVLEFTSHGHDGHMFDGYGNRRECPEGRYRVDAQTDWVLEYLWSRTRERPFFLFLSYIEPHHQNDHRCYEGPHGSKERWRDYTVPGDLEGTGGDWRENYPDYLGCCHSLDENLGRIRAELEELGLSDNTLILYTSDHGSHFCTRNSEYKRACHDACIRVPMVACGPGFRGGRTATSIASLIDVPPTVLRAGGVALPTTVRGRPLQDAVDTPPSDGPQEAFLQISESHVGRAIRTARWTYEVGAPDAPARSGASADNTYEEIHLYDNQADPHQRTNLVSDPGHADVRAELAERLRRRMVEAGEPEPVIRPASRDYPAYAATADQPAGAMTRGPFPVDERDRGT